MTVPEALRHPKVLLLALAYFFVVTGNYGIEFFLPSILQRWYSLELSALTWLVMLPPTLAMVGQLAVGWSSDRTKERRWHTVTPIVIGAIAIMLVTQTSGHAAADDPPLHGRGRRFQGVSAGVLVAAKPVPHRSRGGRQHRSHQLGG